MDIKRDLPRSYTLAKIFQVVCVEDDFYLTNADYLFQAVVCLTQAVGINLGYMFRADFTGPSSSSLSENLRQYFAEKDEIDVYVEDMTLKPEIKAKLETAKVLMEPPKAAEGARSLWLKILSLMYLLAWSEYENRFQLSKETEIKEMIEVYCRSTGYAFLDEAWDRLKEFFGEK